MYDFLRTREDQLAFKKALEQIEQEKDLPAVHTSDTTTQRVYTPIAAQPETEKPVQTQTRYKFRSPVSRPDTSVIDLKNFKNWRDNNAEPTPKPNSATNILDKYAKPSNPDTSISQDFDKYFAERLKARPINPYVQTQTKVEEPAKPKIETKQPEPVKVEVVKPEPVKAEPIKIEVIEKKPEIKENKPKTNRKPRGKNKRRFDADVISSVDWK